MRVLFPQRLLHTPFQQFFYNMKPEKKEKRKGKNARKDIIFFPYFAIILPFIIRPAHYVPHRLSNLRATMHQVCVRNIII